MDLAPRDRLGWPLKAAVLGALAIFVSLGLAAVEEWPFTGWRLYSRVRDDIETGHRAFVVAPDGTERAVDYQQLPVGYRQAPEVLAGFERDDDETRLAACEAIGAGERRAGRAVEAVRIYAVTDRLEIVDGEPVKEVDRELELTCR